jgi:hypothetical protein
VFGNSPFGNNPLGNLFDYNKDGKKDTLKKAAILDPNELDFN